MKLETLRFKLTRLILLPLALCAMMAAGLALFGWLLVFGSDVVPLDEKIVEFWLPMGLGAFLAFGVVGRWIASLDLSEKQNIPFLYGVVAWALMAAPSIFALSYVNATSGDLVRIIDISQAAARTARYYTGVPVCLDRRDAVAHTIVRPTDSHDTNLVFDLYVAAPLCASNTHASSVWLGFKYRDTVPNRESDAAKKAEYRVFVMRSQAAFNAMDSTKYRYFERVRWGDDHRAYAKAVAKSRQDASSIVFLEPHRDAFVRHGGDYFGWIFKSFAIAGAIWSALVLFAPLKPPSERGRREENWLKDLLIPSRTFYGLPILLDLNIGIYIAMVLAGLGLVSFEPDDLIAWGGDYGPALHGLGFLRLVSSQFVHAGLMHLAANMYGLIFAALFLLPVAQNGRLILSYLICGLGGSIASVIVHPVTVSVGASGAIFGLWGVVLALLGLRDPRLEGATALILLNAGLFVVLNLGFGAITPGIDNAAHLGGLATGLVVGATFRMLDNDKGRQAGTETPTGIP